MHMWGAAGSHGAKERGARRSVQAIALAVLALCAASGTLAATAVPPAKGRLLIADRGLSDANFAQSVVLLLEYSPERAIGLIVNRPAGITPGTLLPEMSALAQYQGPVYLGGPVGIQMLVLLVRGCESLDDIEPLFDDVCYSGSPELLDHLAHDGATPSRLRLYVGYAGWDAGQLDIEIARGDWHVIEARDERVFSEEPRALWEHLVPAPQPLETLAPAPAGASRAALAAP
jgi:putative transcriptional regulator